MMCGHCEARVKKALEAVDGVASRCWTIITAPLS